MADTRTTPTENHEIRAGAVPAAPRYAATAAQPTRVTVTDEGPVLVAGPVEIECSDGSVVRSDRAVTALCTCRRSRRSPFCDTSHRRRER